MRRSTAWLLAVPLAGIAAAAPGWGAENPSHGCRDRLACGGDRLPAAITVAAGYGRRSVSYRIGREGRVRRIAAISSPIPSGAALFPATGTWFMFRDGHLIIGRGQQPRWRSHSAMAPRQVGLIMASSQTVAFQHDHKLYLASLAGSEQAVATREMPLGWAHGGLYTYRYQGRALLLRSDSGRLLRTLAREPLGGDYFVANGILYFIARGVLMSAHGSRTRRLASLASLGMPSPWLQPAGRLVELQDNDRLLLLRPDGSVFASTALPREGGRTASLSSSLVVAPDTTAVAFASASDGANDRGAAGHAHGTETVYILRAGALSAVPAHTQRVAFRVCERGASLAWHGRWLLYANSEGSLDAIDTGGARAVVELGGLIRDLPDTRYGFTASWSRR